MINDVLCDGEVSEWSRAAFDTGVSDEDHSLVTNLALPCKVNRKDSDEDEQPIFQCILN